MSSERTAYSTPQFLILTEYIMMKKITIYADGACSGNPGPGGWGAYLKFGEHEKDIFGSEAHTTNNKMELTAAIMALKSLKEPCDVELYTDSGYVKEGITKWVHNWVKKNWMRGKDPVKNVELWKELLDLERYHNISWKWVKGHSGNYGNDRADGLAVKGRDLAKK
jgi:ribonuclease HI